MCVHFFSSFIYLFFIQMDEHIVQSSDGCPMCRKKFKQPHAEAQAADANFMILIAGVRFRSLFCYP